MKHFLKGAASVAIIMIAAIIVNMFCNMHGVDLNSTSESVVLTMFGILIYHIWTRNEKKE